jgi:hypothetical protein
MDARTRQVIAFHVGDRSRKSAKRLGAKIPDTYRQHATILHRFPQIAIRLVALLRRPPDFGASPLYTAFPCSAVGRHSHKYYHRSATSHTLFPKGRFPVRALFRLGLWRVRPGSPLAYSPGTASSLADSQRLPGYLVYPEGLSVQLDH